MKKLLLSLALIFGFVASVAQATPLAYFNSAFTASVVKVNRTYSNVQFLYYNISNPNSSTVYVQFFNAATTGNVTLGTTAPTYVVAIPANGVLDGPQSVPYVFPLGMIAAVTTTPTGSTAPTTNCPITVIYQ